MKYLSITVRNDLFDIFCKLAEKNNIEILRTLDRGNGDFSIQVSYLDNLDLFNLGISLGSYTITFIQN